MDNGEITQRLTEIFRMVFDNEALAIARSTTADDVEGWDSLTHVNLVFAVERSFKIKFTTSEVIKLKDVGDLIDLVAKKAA